MSPNTAAVRLNKRSPPLAEGSVNQLTATRCLLYATCLSGAQGGKHKTTKNPRAQTQKKIAVLPKNDVERMSYM